MFEPKRSSADKIITFRVTEEEKQALTQEADRRGVSVSEIIREALGSYFDAKNKTPSKAKDRT